PKVRNAREPMPTEASAKAPPTAWAWLGSAGSWIQTSVGEAASATVPSRAGAGLTRVTGVQEISETGPATVTGAAGGGRDAGTGAGPAASGLQPSQPQAAGASADRAPTRATTASGTKSGVTAERRRVGMSIFLIGGTIGTTARPATGDPPP